MEQTFHIVNFLSTVCALLFQNLDRGHLSLPWSRNLLPTGPSMPIVYFLDRPRRYASLQSRTFQRETEHSNVGGSSPGPVSREFAMTIIGIPLVYNRGLFQLT
jgi:hypothetical protein